MKVLSPRMALRIARGGARLSAQRAVEGIPAEPGRSRIEWLLLLHRITRPSGVKAPCGKPPIQK